MRITQEKNPDSRYFRYAEEKICFEADGLQFVVKNIAYERLMRIIPRHVHGENSYEFHYIGGGQGWIQTSDGVHQVSENMMYLMGPYEEHAQLSAEDMPMEDYCIYFHLEDGEKKRNLTFAAQLFLKIQSWFGSDNQDIGMLIKMLFRELQEKKTGYLTCVKGILMQIFVRLVRGYEASRLSEEKRECVRKCQPLNQCHLLKEENRIFSSSSTKGH